MVDVFVASAMATEYPRKLQKPSTVSDTVRDTAETFIMDSGIGNDDVTNADVLDLAAEYNADYVIGKDYLHDKKRTTDSIKDFVAHHREHECDATPMIPLQPPHHEHYQTLSNEVGFFDHYVIGGMAGDNVSSRQAALYTEKAVATIHDDAHIHALGVGGGIEYVRLVAGQGYVDSIDCSTPEQAAMFGSVIGPDLRQTEALAFPGGEGKSKRTVPLAEFNSWQVQDVWDREATITADVQSY